MAVETRQLLVATGMHAYLKTAPNDPVMIADPAKGTVKGPGPKALILIVRLDDLGAPGDELSWETFAQRVLEHGRWVRLTDFEADAPTTHGVPCNITFPAHTKTGATAGGVTPDAAKNIAEVALQVTRTRSPHTSAGVDRYPSDDVTVDHS